MAQLLSRLRERNDNHDTEVSAVTLCTHLPVTDGCCGTRRLATEAASWMREHWTSRQSSPRSDGTSCRSSSALRPGARVAARAVLG